MSNLSLVYCADALTSSSAKHLPYSSGTTTCTGDVQVTTAVGTSRSLHIPYSPINLFLGSNAGDILLILSDQPSSYLNIFASDFK